MDELGLKKVLVIAASFHLRNGVAVHDGDPLEVTEAEAADLFALGYARRPKPLEAKRLRAQGIEVPDEDPPIRQGARNRYLRRDLRVKE